MAINYFGKRRMKKILFFYLSDREDIVKEIKAQCREYEWYIMQYEKYRGSEWFKTGVLVGDTYYTFKLSADNGKNGSRIQMKEYAEENYDHDNAVKTIKFYGHAFYDENHYPYTGSSKLCCCDVYKSSPDFTLTLDEETLTERRENMRHMKNEVMDKGNGILHSVWIENFFDKKSGEWNFEYFIRNDKLYEKNCKMFEEFKANSRRWYYMDWLEK